MNNPNNPFVPKGTLLDLQERRRKQFKIAVFCALSVGVVGLTTMLGVQGCKRENPSKEFETTGNEFAANTNILLNIDTNSLPPFSSTNGTAYNTPVETNTLPPSLPPAELPPAANVGGSEYKIQKGDTLAVIAKKNGVGWKAIQAANPKLNPNRLKIGEMITIPAALPKSATSPGLSATTDGSSYTVKPGDNLGKIAKTHHTSVNAIKAANNLKTERINVGQKLVIPTKVEAAPPAMPVVEPVVAPPTPPSTNLFR